MAELPPCPNFRRKTCERSDPILLAEHAEYLEMGCRTCRSGYVITLPDGEQHAQYDNRIQELKRRQEVERQAQKQKTFYAPKGGWQ